MNSVNLKDIPTCQLVEELASREGVEEYCVAPYEPFSILVGGQSKASDTMGPARLLYVYD